MFRSRFLLKITRPHSEKSIDWTVLLLALWSQSSPVSDLSTAVTASWSWRRRLAFLASKHRQPSPGVSSLSSAGRSASSLPADQTNKQSIPWLSQVQVLWWDSVLVLISALWGLCKVLRFKDGTSVRTRFLRSCSAHQLSGVWRGAAALWISSRMWRLWVGVSGVVWTTDRCECFTSEQMFCMLSSRRSHLQSVWIFTKETFYSLKMFKIQICAHNLDLIWNRRLENLNVHSLIFLKRPDHKGIWGFYIYLSIKIWMNL